MYLFELEFYPDVCPRVRLLDPMVTLVFFEEQKGMILRTRSGTGLIMSVHSMG